MSLNVPHFAGEDHTRAMVTACPFLCALSRDKVADAIPEIVCGRIDLEALVNDCI